MGPSCIGCSTFLGLLMFASALNPAVAIRPALPQGFCFRHVGPEDKPMPGFCVRAAGSTAHAPAAHPGERNTFEPKPAALKALFAIVSGQGRAAPARPAPFGEYEMCPTPSGPVLYLPAAAMRRIVEVLQAETGQVPDKKELLERLRRRLGPAAAER